MINKLKQFASFLNLPVLVIVVFFTIICFVIIKFIASSFFGKSSKKSKHGFIASKDKSGNVKGLNRKKRNKKQRSVEFTSEKKQPVVTDDDEAFATLHLNRKISSAPTVEIERPSQINRKQDKKKGKSKKKKQQTDELDTNARVSVAGSHSMVDEEGEWQTVRNKEQKSQRKEKKRQDEITVISSTAVPVKPVATTSYTPAYTSIPSTAKDVAPRFARAAGEEWQEGASKRQSVNNVTKSTTIVNRSPMLPAAAQQPSASKWGTTTTSAPIPDIWESKTATSIAFPAPQDSWSSNKNNVLSWAPTVKSNNWSSKPTTQAWDNTGTPVLDQSEWHGDSKSDEWVHVTTPSPTNVPVSDTWTTSSDVYSQSLHRWAEVGIPAQSEPVVVTERPQKESFRLEPEGLSVSSMDPDDPWNMDAYEKEGDWSPPEAHWSNSNEEWNAPPPVAKPQPTYFDESSDEEKVSSVTSPSFSATSHAVVGAGSEFLQSQNQQANKKARRRRKKKQTDATSDAPKESLTVTPAPIEDAVQSLQPNATKASNSIDTLDVIQNNDVWSQPKQSKKKKPRVRKAE